MRSLMHVPFENLDIHYKRPFDLAPENVFNKIVNHKRGGFCYEVNSLFNDMLTAMGFNSRILEARVYNSEGQVGPAFDHMCLLVKTDKTFLADVGFGDLFLHPLELINEVQFDGRNYFKIEPVGHTPSMC